MDAPIVLKKRFILACLIVSALCAIVLAVLFAQGADAQVMLLSGAGVLLSLGAAACIWAVTADEPSVTTLVRVRERNSRPR